MGLLRLLIAQVDDEIIQENFKRVNEFVLSQPFLNGDFKLFTLTFSGAVTNYKYPHKFSFIPTDVIQTFQTGAGSITFNYSSFDATNLDITTTGACTVRALIGRIRPDNVR